MPPLPTDDRRASAAPGDTQLTPQAGSIPQTAGFQVTPGAALVGIPAELVSHPTYEVLGELGRGGMGVVYLARNKVMDRMEVLKVLQDRLAGSPELIQRFINEVQMAAKLHHPNIVVAYAAFPAGNALVLAMEYIDGTSLHDLVRREGVLPVAQACAFARQAAQGLQKAHDKGMVHRDIKPQNLMVSRDGVVKVLDFGLAKIASETADTSLTGTGMSMGTPNFMPPEQASDAKNADIRSDIYSLGCTLYFLLVGRPPFDGRSAFEVAQAHHTQAAPPLLGVPAGLNDLVARMMAKRPEQRPQTPAEVAKELLPYCQGESRDGLLPAARRGRFGPVLAGVAVVLALVAIGVGLWAAGVFTPAAPRDDKTAQASGTGRASERPVDEGKKREKTEAAPVGKDKEAVVKKEEKKPVEVPRGPAKELTNTVGMKLMLLPAGKFQMGSPEGEVGRSQEEGPHEVRLTRAFYLGPHEVTQKQFKAVMGYNPSFFSADGTAAPGGKYQERQRPAGGKARLKGADTSAWPVENVSWDEAAAYCRRLTEKERKEGKIGEDQEYRLPTEAQWEYACRGGAADSRAFHYGAALSAKDANFDARFPYGGGAAGEEPQSTRAVGSYKPNEYGLYDLHGNVWEWCADWYDKDAYKAGPSPRADPAGPGKGTYRVRRGGSWASGGPVCRSASRSGGAPSLRSINLGFRVALVTVGGE